MPSPDAASNKRDVRIDLIRGLALLFVFTDHISEISSAAGLIAARDFPLPTLRIVTWTTAAEFFVFLSGYVAGIVYSQTLAARGFWLCQARVLRRAGQIARANLVTFILIVPLLSLAWPLSPEAVATLDIGYLRQAPMEALRDFVLGRYTPAYTDILLLYVPLTLLVPAMLWLLRYSRAAAFVLSGILYLTAQISPRFSLPMRGHDFPGADPVWFFNPLAWQFLFFIGLAFGSREALRNFNLFRDYPRLARGLAVLLSISSAEKILFELSKINAFGLKVWLPRLALHGFGLGPLRPLRLAHFFLVFVLALSFIPTGERLQRTKWLGPIIVCGQHSLGVFASGIVLTFACSLALAKLNGGYLAYIAVAVFGIAVQVLTGVILQWMQSEPWRSSPQRQTLTLS